MLRTIKSWVKRHWKKLAVASAASAVLYYYIKKSSRDQDDIIISSSLSSAIELCADGDISGLHIHEGRQTIDFVPAAGKGVIVRAAAGPAAMFLLKSQLKEVLKARKISVTSHLPVGNPAAERLVEYALATLISVVVMKRAMGPTTTAPKQDLYGKRPQVLFSDIIGMDEVKRELEECVDFLKHPERYLSMGARPPRGVLLCGPPGTGKTLLARAAAGEAGVPFVACSASDFVELFVGRGSARVRSLFEEARKHAPSVVFIDELDALGKARGRGTGGGGGSDEYEQTLNALLTEMDGYYSGTDPSRPVLVIAATNRLELLDPALKRSGRFDRVVRVPLPPLVSRESILKHYGGKVAVDSQIEWSAIAQATEGFSGADLAAVVNEAALLAVRKNRSLVTQDCFLEAVAKLSSSGAGNGDPQHFHDSQGRQLSGQELEMMLRSAALMMAGRNPSERG